MVLGAIIFLEIINKHQNFFNCYTTLDLAILMDSYLLNGKFPAASTRPIEWIPIDPLSSKDSEDIIAPSKAAFLDKIPHDSQEKYKIMIDNLTRDCSGHPRSLENLKVLLNSKNSFNITDAVDFIINGANIPFDYDCIMKALLGKELHPSDIVGNDLSFSRAVGIGYLINSFESADYQMELKASIISLMNFAMYNNSNLARSLKWLFNVPDKMDLITFGTFYSNWEVTYRTLLAGRPSDIYNDWFKGKCECICLLGREKKL